MVRQEHEELEDATVDELHGNGRFGVSADISREMVRLYKTQFGRGPTKVRTQWAGDDMIVVVLENTLSPPSATWCAWASISGPRHPDVLQYATVREFCEPVEHLTGRKVRSFLSAIDTEVDGLAMETFLLHPEGYDGPSRILSAEPAEPQA
jgi:uncharacterized protein YbcI